MKSMLVVRAFAASVLVCGSIAYGQPIVNAPVVTGDLDLPPDREVLVREYIVREPLAAPVIIEGGGTIRPGSIVPEYVPLRRFENIAVPSLRPYAYFVSPDNKVVIVDPASRQVVRILSQQ